MQNNPEISQNQKNQRLAQRLRENPRPTPHELIIGCFLEELPEEIEDIVEPLWERGLSLWCPDNYIQDYEKYPHVFLCGMINDQIRCLDRKQVEVSPLSAEKQLIRLELIKLRLKATDDVPARWLDIVNKLPSNGLRPILHRQGASFRAIFQGSQPQEYKGYPIYWRD